MECCMIRMMYGVRLGDRVGVVMKIEDMIFKVAGVAWSCHGWRHQFQKT